ncbi:substrate-binding periplasmic protein [Roseateles sp. DC23W]|uniref:Substrate-binding periplasmic protein n=1 Tax=Pelomonas dachongensis TaxID=3299029 RepID=A0ABW7ESG1_9BURK
MVGHDTGTRQGSGRRAWLAQAFALAALGGSAVAQAAECARPLRVAVSDLGVGAYVEDGQIRGLIPDLVRELQARTGCPLQLVFMPRARALLDFDKGGIDIITSMMQSPERDRIAAYLPYGYTKHDLLVVPEAAAGVGGLADVIRRPDLRLGVVRGIRTSSRVDTHLEQLLAIRRAEYSPDFANLAAKLAARRIQVALMPNALHVKLRRDGALPADLVVIDEPEARPQRLGLYVNRQVVPPRMIARLQQQLAEMVRRGWVRQAYVQHFGEAETRRMESALGAR